MTAIDNDVRQRLALLLEVACEQFELADCFAKNEFCVTAPNGTEKTHLQLRSNSTVQMALAKEFLFNVSRAYRLIDHGSGKLGLEREARKTFMEAIKPIVDVRDVNEHGNDAIGKSGGAIKRPKPHSHEVSGINVSVDETSMVSINGEMLLGPLKPSEIYKCAHKLKVVAGFSSLNKIDDASPIV